MFEHRDPAASKFITCELSADDFDLYEGDTIAPGSEIGIDIRSGSAVYLDGWGRVETVYYNQMNDSYRVMIRCTSKSRPGLSASRKNALLSA
jgi:hypothetical protein